MIEPISKFLHYWYFRYLMVTELYMVEKWERATINIFFIILFSCLSYFNYAVTLRITSQLLNYVVNTIIPTQSPASILVNANGPSLFKTEL